MTAYYNEFEPFAAQWLKNLSDAGHIAKGRVGKLRAYGNAIVSEVAATFIKAVMQSLDNANR